MASRGAGAVMSAAAGGGRPMELAPPLAPYLRTEGYQPGRAGGSGD